MGIGDIWDYIVDGFDYIIHFEWLIDIKDFFVDVFSNLGEFSPYGLVFGVVSAIFLLLTKPMMLDSFTKHMSPLGGIITTILTFGVTFFVCYIMGSRFENN